ncbi:MAG: hypothetical protein R6X13_07095 [bacterium]
MGDAVLEPGRPHQSLGRKRDGEPDCSRRWCQKEEVTSRRTRPAIVLVLLALTFGAYSASALPYHVKYIDFSSGNAEGDIDLVAGEGAEFSAHADNTSHIRITVNGGYVSLRFTLRDDWSRPVNLILMHLSSHAGDHPGYSPVDIIVNGTKVCREQAPGARSVSETGSYGIDKYDVTGFVRSGRNTLTLRMCDDARTHYWVKWLMVCCN